VVGFDPALNHLLGSNPLTLEELRYKYVSPSLVPTRDITIPSRATGVMIGARVYNPPATQPRPILVYIHGGGWVRGSVDTYNTISSRISLLGINVVSIEYRLAPESKFPWQIYDVVDSIRWIVNNREAIRGSTGDKDDVIIIGGDSAGGHLAAAALINIIEQDGKLPQQIVGELLVYPATDAYMNSASWKLYGDNYRLTRVLAEKMWNWFLQSEKDKESPYATLTLTRGDLLAKLPPTLIFTAEFDPLRDEGEHFAAMLNAQGVTTECVRFLSNLHGFFSQGEASGEPWHEPYSKLALSITGDWIKKIATKET